MENTVLLAQESDAGTRVDAFLASRLAVSRARAQKILESATVDGKIVKAKHTLRGGETVVVTVIEEETPVSASISPEELENAPDIPVLFEDDDLLVINKPIGVTVHAGAGETGPTLVDLLRARGTTLSSVGPEDRAGLVHRLDKDTGGVMIVAKTDAAHWKLAADFEARRISKHYLALVCGVPPQRGRIEAAIGRHHTQRKKMAVVPEGRMAVTEYEMLKKWEKFALLDVDLLTGRTHQIRVHMAYLYHPVVGDGVYGGVNRAVTSAPTPEVRAAVEKLDGQALLAQRIAFTHPTTGTEVAFEAPLPAPFAAVIEALDKS